MSAVPSSGRSQEPGQSRSAAKSSPGDEPPAEGEPEILEGLARDIVSRLATTLFGEDDLPIWRRGPAPAEAESPGETAPVVKNGAVAGHEPESAGGPLDEGGALTAGPAESARGSGEMEVGSGRGPIDLFAAAASAPRRARQVGVEHPALLVRGTVRSGRQVRHNGDVAVLGDVNPGGQIVAAGDVVVMGTLRGMVHAGATGDHAAVVAAFRLCPTQLRIASYVARPPEEPGGYPQYPELALVREGIVVVRPLTTGMLGRGGLDDKAPCQHAGRRGPLTGE